MAPDRVEVRGAPSSEGDGALLDGPGEERLYEALRNEWLPVAYSSEVGHTPMAVTLMAEHLVLVRLDGTVSAFADLCPHRGARLSLGWCSGGALQCPYHGWRFGADGKCVEIPADPGGRIPTHAALRRYQAVEAGGMVWVCPNDPAPGAELPQLPEAHDPTYRLVEVPAYDWRCGVNRRIENFVDLSHLPWIHDEVLGRRDDPVVPEHRVQRRQRRITMQSKVVEHTNPKSRRAAEGLDAAVAGRGVVTDQEWLITAPVTLWWRQAIGAHHFGLLLAASPLGPELCRTFTILFRNFAMEASDDDELVKFHLEVAEADRPVVESQRPHELPYDLTSELHLKATDLMSVEYRRALRDLATAQR